MSIRPRTVSALAAAMALGTTAGGVGVAGAATAPRAPSSATARGAASTGASDIWRVRVDDDGATLANAAVRTTSDDSFLVTRTLVDTAGVRHVVFTATNVRTGATCVMNGTT